jgi:hypothetical protein
VSIKDSIRSRQSDTSSVLIGPHAERIAEAKAPSEFETMSIPFLWASDTDLSLVGP